jgi:hypothetical protein
VFFEINTNGDTQLGDPARPEDPSVVDFREGEEGRRLTSLFDNLPLRRCTSIQDAGMSTMQAELTNVGLYVTLDEYRYMMLKCDIILTQQAHVTWSGVSQEWKNDMPCLWEKLVLCVVRLYAATEVGYLRTVNIVPSNLTFHFICETRCPGVYVLLDCNDVCMCVCVRATRL